MRFLGDVIVYSEYRVRETSFRIEWDRLNEFWQKVPKIEKKTLLMLWMEKKKQWINADDISTYWFLSSWNQRNSIRWILAVFNFCQPKLSLNNRKLFMSDVTNCVILVSFIHQKSFEIPSEQASVLTLSICHLKELCFSLTSFQNILEIESRWADSMKIRSQRIFFSIHSHSIISLSPFHYSSFCIIRKYDGILFLRWNAFLETDENNDI